MIELPDAFTARAAAISYLRNMREMPSHTAHFFTDRT